jgi:large subunit ribosomal protein L32
MPLPKKRHPSSRKRRRAAHFALKKVNVATCPKCKQAIMPHTACSFCGTYKNREVVKPRVKAKKTSKK